MVCRLLVPQLGIEPTPRAEAAQNLNCWTTRQVPRLNFFEELPDYTPERSFSTLYSHRQHMRVWIFLHPLQHLFSVFYLLLQPSQWYLIVILIGIFLMVNDFEYLVMCLLDIWVSSLGKCLITFANFKLLCVILLLSYNSLYILDTNSLPDIWFANFSCILVAFSLSWCSFNHKNFILMMSNWSVFVFCCLFLVSYQRNHWLIQGHKDWSLYFLARALEFLLLQFRSLMHFELIFIYGMR